MPKNDHGAFTINPSLVAYKDNVAPVLSPYAPPRDEAGNFLIAFGLRDANPRLYAAGQATLEVQRGGAWVTIGQQPISTAGAAAFPPVAFTPEFGDVSVSEYWPNGRIDVRLTVRGRSKSQPVSFTHVSAVYLCPSWGWGGCGSSWDAPTQE